MNLNLLTTDMIFVSLLGGVLCLDRIVLQLAICRPLVSAPLIGWLLGDAYTGIVAGALIELFWIDRLPLGVYIPPNDTLVAILVTAGTILAGRLLGSMSQALLALAVLLFLPLGLCAQRLEGWHYRINESNAQAAVAEADKGDGRAITRRHRFAILRYYGLSAGLIALMLPLGTLLLYWGFPRLPVFATQGLTLFYSGLPLIGCAVALQTISVRGAIPVFCSIFLAFTALIAWVQGG